MCSYYTGFALRAGAQAARLQAGATYLDRDSIAEDLEAITRAWLPPILERR